MGQVVTVLDARVVPERTADLRAAYADAMRGPFPPGLVRTALLQHASDPAQWRIETVWESPEALAAMRQAPGKPRGVLIFEAAGARPVLTVFHAIDGLGNESQGADDRGPRQRWSVAPCLVVDDVVRTATYYRDTLGFHYDRFWNDPPSFCMVKRGGVVIMLAQAERGGAMRPNQVADPGRAALDAYLWIDDADALFAEFKAAGAMIVRDIGDRPYGCRDFDVEDCDGYRLCFGHDLEG
ncbi:MAG: VOC family protein [Gemmatimonadota bacterium]|nr:VOC family protein [Gemmatimonadota bacterium]